MFTLFKTIADLDSLEARAALARRRYGRIEVAAGQLVGVRLMPWPKLASLPEVMLGQRRHSQTPGDRCWLYYNQPLGHANFLALSYVVSNRDCTLATFQLALTVLDEIARFKQSDAIVCEAWNQRISDRLLARWGWAPHTSSRRHRNFIKRFYGDYPATRLTRAAALPDDAEQLLHC